MPNWSIDIWKVIPILSYNRYQYKHNLCLPNLPVVFPKVLVENPLVRDISDIHVSPTDRGACIAVSSTTNFNPPEGHKNSPQCRIYLYIWGGEIKLTRTNLFTNTTFVLSLCIKVAVLSSVDLTRPCCAVRLYYLNYSGGWGSQVLSSRAACGPREYVGQHCSTTWCVVCGRCAVVANWTVYICDAVFFTSSQLCFGDTCLEF
jgi:hypothetical protein